jgi:hypothetical protein
MLNFLNDGSYMFRQNIASLREQQGSFLSYFNVNMVVGKSWNVLGFVLACRAANSNGTLQVHTAEGS